MTDTNPQPDPERSSHRDTRRALLVPAVAATITLGIGVAIGYMLGTGTGDTAGGAEPTTARTEPSATASQTTTTPAPEPVLTDAVDECAARDGFTIGDDGESLSINGEGDSFTVDTANIDRIACVMIQLEIPDAVSHRIDNTTAMDGTQEANWDDLYMTWNYHPDNGLDMVIERQLDDN